MMGYKTKIIKLTSGKSGAYNIELSEDTKVLPDLIVFPGSNPAIEFMQQVRAAKTSNNPLLFKEYTPTVQEKTTAAISQTKSKSLNKNYLTIYKRTFNNTRLHFFLPVYLSEDNYRLHEGQKTILHNYQNSIILSENNSLKELANKLPTEVNFYDNYISLFGKNFLSPLAETAGYAYNYYLKDSISTSTIKNTSLYFNLKTKRTSLSGNHAH
jgi:hypothetical protein